ncbi:unnamed protein product [Litomosoides sigmodontis]|uniref:Uncharacterized protein n=1 Tax=Litomosoides sigmodontis TaxID=42156 RepID=A0A3P6TYE3_LITSI|nr:unnamed protein product [Litomosoides sigmodontis]
MEIDNWRTVLIDATPTTLLKALPDATIIPINAAPITNVIRQTTPSNDIIPSFDGKHETVSGATEVIPEMKSVNPVASDAMIPPIHDTATEMKSITVDSSLQSATAITSSPQIDGKFAARSHLMQHLKASQKTPNNDTVNVEWSNIQLKANSSITPIITYDQSVPKARLDQWKWEVNQQQPLINQSLIDSNSNDNRNATVNNSNTILLSTISLISSFLPLFVPQLISL